jgi:hypothetical protein
MTSDGLVKVAEQMVQDAQSVRLTTIGAILLFTLSARRIRERFGCDLSVKNVRLTELPARQWAIAIVRTETAEIARPTLAG